MVPFLPGGVSPRPTRLIQSAANPSVFAEVLVDIQARELGDRLFTYRVPEHLNRQIFVGAQVLVPFGRQELVGGYVVSMKDTAPPDISAREVADVLDTEPLFDSQYVDFLYWVADYCVASLSSVIAAAVPADFTPRLKRMAELSSAEVIEPESTRHLEMREDGCRRILAVLRGSPRYAASLRALRQRTGLSQPQFYRCLTLLRETGLVRLRTESGGRVAPKTITAVSWTGQPGQTPRHEAIIGTLRRHGGQLPMSMLIDSVGTTHATIKRMCAQGILALTQEEVLRDPLERVPADDGNGTALELTAAQQEALSVLTGELRRMLASEVSPDRVTPWLLYGVTGSGKTEVYLRLIENALLSGRTAQLLVPEISLTPQLAQRLKCRFGASVAVWHSALSAGERYDTWRRLRAGDVKVLLGARSSIFAHMPQVGLIILDEEHDASYKQSNPSPRYHARVLALEKARRWNALVLLGSATPDVCSYHLACSSGRLLELPTRVFQQKLPEVRVVDMRKEFASGNRTIFSNLLSRSLADCLSRKEQAILLINRRGYANHVFCRACGYVVKCKSCSVSMVFHQPHAGSEHSAYLACHHCDHRSPASPTCPSCLQPFLKEYGLGTQKVEQELQRLFPEARLLRLDADVAARRGAYEEVFRKFSQGQSDILIGTQMVAKGLDIPRVTVVGVLAADAAFNLPDYRSLERGFQLLTQVSGRAGRGLSPGTVIWQTYNTEMPVLAWAGRHDYQHFVQQELAARRELSYPPFSQIFRIIISGGHQLPVQAECEELAEELTRFLEDEVEPAALKILGPAPCLIERLRGKYRYHLLVKNLAGQRGHHLLAGFLRCKRPAPGLNMAIDVDAFDIL
ncbi:MAG TPA: primosomal protein N' [Candidatus Obscuribacterales bacterium]